MRRHTVHLLNYIWRLAPRLSSKRVEWSDLGYADRRRSVCLFVARGHCHSSSLWTIWDWWRFQPYGSATQSRWGTYLGGSTITHDDGTGGRGTVQDAATATIIVQRVGE